MLLQEAKCTNCGAQLSVNDSDLKVTCPFCDTEFIVQQGLEFRKSNHDEVDEISNFRKLLSEAVLSNDISNIDRYASKILMIIPNDFLSRYFYAYAEGVLGKRKYINDFYLTRNHAYTEKDRLIVTEHIIKYSDLRDNAQIINLLGHLFDFENENIISAYKNKFEERKSIEENYDIIRRDVFICHSTNDQEKATYVLNQLEADGLKCWISSRNLRPNDNENYWTNINLAIKSCAVFIVISSEHAMLSKDVKKELFYAKELQKPRIEIKVDQKAHTSFFADVFDGLKWIDALQGVNFVIDDIKLRVNKEVIKQLEILDYNQSYSNEASITQGVGVSVQSLIKKAKIEIDDKLFDEAIATLNKALEIDAENGEIWLLMTFASYQVTSSDELAKISGLQENRNYKKAMKFGNDEIKNALREINKKAKNYVADKLFLLAEEDKKNSQYESMLKNYKKASDLGHPIAQYYMFVHKARSKNKLTVKENLSLLIESASNKYVPSQILLSKIYSNPKYDLINEYEAIYWLKKAVENDSDEGKKMLSNHYIRLNRSQDEIKEALSLKKDLADNGDIEECFDLGLIYYEGLVTPQNYSESFKYLNQAAQNNYSEAQFILAFMYKEGLGTKPDINKSREYYQKAARNGHKLAIEIYKKMAK